MLSIVSFLYPHIQLPSEHLLLDGWPPDISDTTCQTNHIISPLANPPGLPTSLKNTSIHPLLRPQTLASSGLLLSPDSTSHQLPSPLVCLLNTSRMSLSLYPHCLNFGPVHHVLGWKMIAASLLPLPAPFVHCLHDLCKTQMRPQTSPT